MIKFKTEKMIKQAMIGTSLSAMAGQVPMALRDLNKEASC